MHIRILNDFIYASALYEKVENGIRFVVSFRELIFALIFAAVLLLHLVTCL